MPEGPDPPATEATNGPADGSDRGNPWRPDPSADPTPGVHDHLAPDDADERPWVDPAKDPTPGRPGHLAPDDGD